MIRDTNRSIFHAVAMLGVLGLGFWVSPAAAQLAPWQQPPGSDRTDLLNGPQASPAPHPIGEVIPTLTPPQREGTPPLPTPDFENSSQLSTPWAGEDYEQEGNALGFRTGYLSNLAYESVHDRFWVHSEFLAWWSKGFATPPLLTTSPAGTDASQAGVLGTPGTSVLFGGKDLSGGFRPGERITFGAWLCSRRPGESKPPICKSTGRRSSSTPAASRRRFSRGLSSIVKRGTGFARLINYPGQQSGTFSSAVPATSKSSRSSFARI